jgi:hypothetical protein
MKSGIPSGLSPFGFSGSWGPGQIGSMPYPNQGFSGLPAGRGLSASNGPPPTVTSATGTTLTASGNTCFSVKTKDGTTIECSGDPHWKVTAPDGTVTYFDTSKNSDLTLKNGDKIFATVSDGSGTDKGFSVTRSLVYTGGGDTVRMAGIDGGNPHFIDANGNPTDAAHAVTHDGYVVRGALDSQRDDNLEIMDGKVYKQDGYGNQLGRITGRGEMVNGSYTQTIDTNDKLDPNQMQPNPYTNPVGYSNWVRGKMVDDFANGPVTPDQATNFGKFIDADNTNSAINQQYTRDARRLWRLENNPPPYFGGLGSYYPNWNQGYQPSQNMWQVIQQAIQQQQMLQYTRYAGIYN